MAPNNGNSSSLLPQSKTTEVEPAEEVAGGSAPVPYTSRSTFSPSPVILLVIILVSSYDTTSCCSETPRAVLIISRSSLS